MPYLQTNKQRVNKNRVIRKGQEGVTLLLTLMIMAALSAIVFSISAIALNELHTADNELSSEPAITAAEGVAEEQLFLNERAVNTACNTSGSEQFTQSGVSTTYLNSFYNNGAYNFGVSPNAEQDFYLYNPCNQGSNTAPGYTSVTLQLQNGASASATVSLCTWGNTNCSGNPDITSRTLSPGGTVTFDSGVINPNNQYVIAVNYGNGSASGNFSIQTTSNNANITGIPASSVTIITTGSKNGSTRKLQTQLPQ
jgi:hypothetical protein